jgi:hypothetical protein
VNAVYVLSHKNKDFYYIYKVENEVLHGYKITRYLSNMHSFSEYDENQKIEVSWSTTEEKGYRIVGRTVAMKDSEYKLIV